MKRKTNKIKSAPPSQEDRSCRAWIRGYKIAARKYPGDIRACRIFAIAYAQGFMNGLRANRRRPISEPYFGSMAQMGMQMGQY